MPRKLICPAPENVAKKWAEVTPGRSGYYEANTPVASSLWETNTTKAKGTYKAAVADPRIAERYAGGARGKASKFARKVTDVGVTRFGPGVAAAETDMSAGFSPYAALLNTLTVPDRKPRGDPANKKIIDVIFDALHKKRLALLGAGGSVGTK